MQPSAFHSRVQCNHIASLMTQYCEARGPTNDSHNDTCGTILESIEGRMREGRSLAGMSTVSPKPMTNRTIGPSPRATHFLASTELCGGSTGVGSGSASGG